MTADTRSPARIPVFPALICLAIVLIVFLSLHAGEGNCAAAGSPAVSCPCLPATLPAAAAPALPGPLPAIALTADYGTGAPVQREFAGLDLERPPAEDLVPYTARGFPDATVAAIAWWMSPGFMDNTSEFRRYERDTEAGRASYPEEHRIFFGFIEEGLDDAEERSVLKNDIILFRGIGPGFAATVLDTAEYREQSFASTSYDIALPLDSYGTPGPDGYRNIIVLERQAGDHALYIGEDEREFLLPRRTDWNVVRTVNAENLTVNADYQLHNRNVTTAFFDSVRLIYVTETSGP